MMYSDDPATDFAYHDMEQCRKLDILPVCENCGEPIQDEHLFLINDEFLCWECLKENYRKRTEDYCDY